MKIFFIVEGDSDKMLLEGQRDWFSSLGINFCIRPTQGKPNMIKKSINFYRAAIHSGADEVIFLVDQNGDPCATYVRQKLRIDSEEKSATIVMKREMEAWVLADGSCIQKSISLQYHPAGITDQELNPKQRLHCILKRKLGYMPSELEAITKVNPRFSIENAARNNTSARRFKELIENLAVRSHS